MAYKNIVEIKIGDLCIATRDISSISSTIECGDEVVITDVCKYRGFSLKHETSGIEVIECGWDCVKLKEKANG